MLKPLNLERNLYANMQAQFTLSFYTDMKQWNAKQRRIACSLPMQDMNGQRKSGAKYKYFAHGRSKEILLQIQVNVSFKRS